MCRESQQSAEIRNKYPDPELAPKWSQWHPASYPSLLTNTSPASAHLPILPHLFLIIDGLSALWRHRTGSPWRLVQIRCHRGPLTTPPGGGGKEEGDVRIGSHGSALVSFPLPLVLTALPCLLPFQESQIGERLSLGC